MDSVIIRIKAAAMGKLASSELMDRVDYLTAQGEGGCEEAEMLRREVQRRKALVPWTKAQRTAAATRRLLREG